VNIKSGGWLEVSIHWVTANKRRTIRISYRSCNGGLEKLEGAVIATQSTPKTDQPWQRSSDTGSDKREQVKNRHSH